MFNSISHKTKAILAGIFILVAYGVLLSFITQSKVAVMIADAISGLAVIGIAVLVYPLVKTTNKPIAASYLVLKYLEGILMIIAAVLFLFSSLQYTRDLIYDGIHLYVFIISAFFFYYLLYKSKLVPRFISIWGAVAILFLLISSVLNLFNIQYTILDYFLVLIITNEVFLAVWLMVKGFNKTTLDINTIKEKYAT